jgi:hypothetical protein
MPDKQIRTPTAATKVIHRTTVPVFGANPGKKILILKLKMTTRAPSRISNHPTALTRVVFMST